MVSCLSIIALIHLHSEREGREGVGDARGARAGGGYRGGGGGGGEALLVSI